MSAATIEQYLTKYPFLDTARATLEESDLSLDSMFEEEVREAARNRIVGAVKENAAYEDAKESTSGDLERRMHSDGDVRLLSYPLSRILVSIIDNDELTDAYAEGEAATAKRKIRNDLSRDQKNLFEDTEDRQWGTRKEIHLGDINEDFSLDIRELDEEELFSNTVVRESWRRMDGEERATFVKSVFNPTNPGFFDSESMGNLSWSGLYEKIDRYTGFGFDDQRFFTVPVSKYIGVIEDEEGWELTNRTVFNGRVLLEYKELLEFIEIKIYKDIQSDLPVDVPQQMADRLNSDVATLIDELHEYTDAINVKDFPLLNSDMLPRAHTLGQTDYSEYAPLGKDSVDIPIQDIRNHYRYAEDVYSELGMVDDMHTSWLGAQEHAGWYISGSLENEDENPKAWEENFPKWTRPSILPDDFDASSAGRSVYTTNTYAKREDFTKRFYRVEGNSRVFMDEELEDEEEQTQLPDYDDLGAYSLIVDIDLEDDWKTRPLPDKYKEVVEQRLEAWVGAFSQFLGGEAEDVFVVDSGGGAYVMTPPAATKPLRDEFEEDDLYTINNEIQVRMRELTNILDEIITSLDNAPTDLFSADAVQNKNRQWKTLMSVHADLDVVVHPVDPLDIDYDEVKFDEVSEEHYEQAEKWASEFTDMSHESHIGSLVHALFGSGVFEQAGSNYQSFEGDNWVEVLENFLEKKEEAAASRERVMELIESDKDFSDVGVTTEKAEVDAAIANVDLKKYLQATHVQSWDTDNRSDGTTSFAPKTWRNPSPDANSCFYGPRGGNNGSPVFVDRKDGWTAGIIDLIAYEEGITNHPSETPSGSDWWKAVNALRERGEDIPVYLPDIEEDDYNYDKLGKTRIARAGKALGTVEENDIEEKDGQHGTYLEITDDEAYNETLEVLEEEGISHGRNKRGSN